MRYGIVEVYKTRLMLRFYDLWSSISMGNLGEINHKQKSQIRHSQFVTSIKLHVEVEHVLVSLMARRLSVRGKKSQALAAPQQVFVSLPLNYQCILFWLLYLALMVSLFLLCYLLFSRVHRPLQPALSIYWSIGLFPIYVLNKLLHSLAFMTCPNI